MAILISVFLEFIVIVSCEQHVVNTPSGPIQGLTDVAVGTNEKIDMFFGIPYAKPPVGLLRFSKPEPIEPWTNVLDATEYFGKPLCLQNIPEFLKPGVPKSVQFSEDCLYLNIYAPQHISGKSKLPVLVWIHGGCFSIGGFESIGNSASNIVASGNIIVVTIRYRLNIFGFLSLNNKYMKGNYGLWDQKLALSWINKNIESFGGNPDQVTLSGVSVGGFSAHMQGLIPSNKGLFQRILAVSGTSSFWAITKTTPKTTIDEVSRKSGCPLSEDYEAFVKCLREIPANELSKQLSHFMSSRHNASVDMPYHPVIDGELFPDFPHTLMKDKTSDSKKFFQSLDFLTGVTSFEGSFQYLTHSKEVQDGNVGFNVQDGITTNTLCNQIAPSYAEDHFNGNKDISKAICNFYTVQDGDLKKQTLRALEIWADSAEKVPAIDALKSHTNDNSKTASYFYMTSKIHKFNFLPPNPPSWLLTGCCHGDDLSMLFKISYDSKIIDNDDIQFANILQKYFLNFVKSGNPNTPETPTILWPQYNTVERKYMDLDIKCNVKKDMAPDATQFWLYDIQEIQKRTKDEL